MATIDGAAGFFFFDFYSIILSHSVTEKRSPRDTFKRQFFQLSTFFLAQQSNAIMCRISINVFSFESFICLCAFWLNENKLKWLLSRFVFDFTEGAMKIGKMSLERLRLKLRKNVKIHRFLKMRKKSWKRYKVGFFSGEASSEENRTKVNLFFIVLCSF